jgi:hypothetical protein
MPEAVPAASHLGEPIGLASHIGVPSHSSRCKEPSMNAIATRFSLLASAAALVLASAVSAAPIAYQTTLSGPNESPPNASPGTGTATLTVDTATHQWTMHVQFQGLLGTTTASHTHAATAVAGVSTAGVATTTPTYAGFPLGVTAGTYDNTFDMTLASSYNPSYVSAHGGTTTQAELDLAQAIADGKAYLNIHSSVVGSGEIRGFWAPVPVSASPKSWGQIRNLYR